MLTDDTDTEGLISDMPEMRRLLDSLSKLPPEKRLRLVKLIESAINPSDSEEPPEEAPA